MNNSHRRLEDLRRKLAPIREPSEKVSILRDALAEADCDEERYEVLDRLGFFLFHIDPDESIASTKQVLRSARASGDRYWQARGLMRLSSYRNARIDDRVAVRYLKKAGRLLESISGRHAEKSFVYRALGELTAKRLGEIDLPMFARSLEHARKSDNPTELGFSLCDVSEACYNAGLFADALDVISECLELLDTIPLDVLHARAMWVLGTIQMSFENWDKSESALKKALDLFEHAGIVEGQATTYKVLGCMYRDHGQYDSALSALERSADLYDQMGNREIRAVVLTDIGRVYAAQEKYGEALATHRLAQDLAEEVDNRSARASAMLATAEVKIACRQWEPAVELLREVLSVVRGTGMFEMVRTAHRLLAEAFEESGDYAASLVHHKEFIERERSVVNRAVQFRLVSLELNGVLGRTREEAEYHRGRSQRFEEEAMRRSQESAALSLQMARTSSFLHDLRKRLLALGSSSTELLPILEEMVRDIDRNADHLDVLKTFEERLTQLDRRFAGALTERCPELTSAELRICFLLRMNLTNKEMALLLNVSDRTVDTHRTRIRRKLDLQGRENLSTVLSAI